MRIIIVVPPDRFDFYSYLNELENHELILLWHVKPKDFDLSLNALPIKFSKIIYWGDFRTPKQLLKKIEPDRIIFFEIIDLRQIALIVQSKKFGIRTFYLEHGAAGDKDTAIARWGETSFKSNTLPYLLKRLTKSFTDVIKSKWFYYAVRTGFSSTSSYLKYFKLPFLMMKGVPNKVLAHCKFDERIPDKAIVFNQANFAPFELYTGIKKKNALFTGVPMFDKYYLSTISEKDYFVFIDHPYLESELFEWTRNHHQYIAQTLFQFAEKEKIKIYIKLHPVSKKETWEKYNFNKQYVEIIQDGDFTQLFLSSKLILGYSSSLINGFLCAKKNIVLLGWHPKPQIVGIDFSETGLCHKSLDPSELFSSFNNWTSNNLTLTNQVKYNDYLLRFNYPFDGQATQRVLSAITENEVL